MLHSVIHIKHKEVVFSFHLFVQLFINIPASCVLLHLFSLPYGYWQFSIIPSPYHNFSFLPPHASPKTRAFLVFFCWISHCKTSTLSFSSRLSMSKPPLPFKPGSSVLILKMGCLYIKTNSYTDCKIFFRREKRENIFLSWLSVTLSISYLSFIDIR